MTDSEAWYIIKQPAGHCEITSVKPDASSQKTEESNAETWGPFSSQSEAIARRVGLIRAGKCQPI